MANRQSRDPGTLSRFTARAEISSVPGFAVEQGDAARALEALSGTLVSRVKRMADSAAQREGEAAGQAAGEQAGRKFVEKIGLEAKAQKSAATRAGGAAQGKTPTKAVSARTGQMAGPGGPSGLNEAPLQLRNDGTIRGTAFYEAAMRAYGWRMQEGVTNELAQAYADNQDSPGGYEKAIGEIRERYLAEPNIAGDGAIREIFERSFVDKVAPARLSIRARHEARLAAEQRAAATDALEAQRKELERDAYNLGGNPEADTLLAPRVAALTGQIENAVRDGTFTPAQGEKLSGAIEATLVNARTTGTFDALPTPELQREFALSVMEDYAEGKGPFGKMGLEQASALSDELYRKAVANENRLRAEGKAEIGQLQALIADDVASIAATGQGLDPAESGLSADKVELLLGEDGLAEWNAARRTAQRGYEATAGMELEPEAEIAARLEALTPEPGMPGFADAAAIQASAAKRAQAILEERATDPLGQAHRAGLVELTPLDVTSAEALTASLGKRRIEAGTVATSYGTAPQIFRPEERVSLTHALIGTPELIPAFAGSVKEALGDLAPAAMAELGEAGPVIALSGELAIDTGSNGVAQDVAAVLAARRDKKSTVKLPSDGKFTEAAGAALGASLSEVPDLRSAVIGTANLLFEREAEALGFDPADVNDPKSEAFAAYERSIERALGARVVGGVKWGGLAEVNGRAVRAPSFMPADELQRVIETLTEADLGALAPIASSNGVSVRASDLRRARLVTLGDGVYGVALGDPESFDPQFLVTPAGELWELDVGAIRSSRAERPAPPPMVPGMGGR